MMSAYQFQKEIVYVFDKTVFSICLSYKKHDNLQVGYMNIFQQLAAEINTRIYMARAFAVILT
jgi:hypothetical protein